MNSTPQVISQYNQAELQQIREKSTARTEETLRLAESHPSAKVAACVADSGTVEIAHGGAGSRRVLAIVAPAGQVRSEQRSRRLRGPSGLPESFAAALDASSSVLRRVRQADEEREVTREN